MQQPGRSWPTFEEKRKFRNPKQTQKEKDTENPNPETQKIIQLLPRPLVRRRLDYTPEFTNSNPNCEHY